MTLSASVIEKLNNLGGGFPAKQDFKLGDYLAMLGLGGLRSYVNLSEDFLSDGAVGLGNENWTTTSIGGGAVVPQTAGPTLVGAAGVNVLQTAALNAVAISRQNNVMIPLGFGAISIEIRSQLTPLVPDGVNNFRVRFGLGNQLTAAAPTNGLSFLFDMAISLNWITESIFAGVTNQKISSVVAVPSLWQSFRIEVNAAGTVAEFYINDVLVNTHNLVVVLNEQTIRFMPVIQMVKTLGAVAREHFIDYVWLSKEVART